MDKPSTLIDLEDWKRRKRAAGQLAAKSQATDTGADRASDDFPVRLRQNLVAGLAVVALLCFALWLFGAMRELNTKLDCLQSGRTNCDPTTR